MKITVELEDDVAWSLAQFCKRSTFDTFRNAATSDREANEMIDGIIVLRSALNAAGFDPR